jgi:hypothetical protein
VLDAALLILVTLVLPAVFTALYARTKGYELVWAFVIALVAILALYAMSWMAFAIFVVIAALLLPDRTRQSELAS